MGAPPPPPLHAPTAPPCAPLPAPPPRRCVSPNLLARITSDDTVAAALPSNAVFSTKMAYFFSGNDALEKYLRMGFPQEPGHSTSRDDDGLITESNGLALLEQVGYPVTSANASVVYILNVIDRRALEKAEARYAPRLPYNGGASVTATWRKLKEYCE